MEVACPVRPQRGEKARHAHREGGEGLGREAGRAKPPRRFRLEASEIPRGGQRVRRVGSQRERVRRAGPRRMCHRARIFIPSVTRRVFAGFPSEMWAWE